MECEARILEQGIEAPALDRRRIEPGKRVRGDQQEGVETEREGGLRAERGDQGSLPRPPRQERDEGAGDRQHGHPHQHRTFVVSPCAGDLVDERLGAVAILEYQSDRQIGSGED